jgi:Holliday junction resolvase
MPPTGADLMTDNNESQFVPINPTARIVFKALEQIGWTVENPSLLVERIKRLDIGIPAEDEFAFLISWMGKCGLVHKLEQEQSPPESKKLYRVPDLLAFFRYKNHLIPALIEVKTSVDDKLSWRPDYLDGLKLYAATLNLPLLVAWKWNRFGLWTLFEAKHFTKSRKNYTVNSVLALRENLMSILAGDFAVELCKGVGFYLVFRKEAELESPNTKRPDTKTWRARVEEAFFTNSKGERIDKLGPGLWSIFLCSHFEDHTEVINDTKIMQSFVIEEESMQFAHRMLPILLQFKSGKTSTLRWRNIRFDYSVPVPFQTLRKAASGVKSSDIVKNVITIAPNTKPEFLKDD